MFSTSWSKDGRKFAVANQDGEVTVWDRRYVTLVHVETVLTCHVQIVSTLGDLSHLCSPDLLFSVLFLRLGHFSNAIHSLIPSSFIHLQQRIRLSLPNQQS